MAALADFPRRVRSFVRREGRMTPAQRRALDEHWPEYGIDFAPGPLDLDALFGRHAARVMEIGFGNGDALLKAAVTDPGKDFIGIEVHRPGAGALLRRAAEAGVMNLRISTHDAVEVLDEQIPPASLAEVRLFFPDPWPKKRHHKRRIIQPAFVAMVAGRLAPGGRIHIATDWSEYAEWMLEVLRGCPLLDPRGGYTARPDSRPLTRFERRGRHLGHEVRDLVFTRAPARARAARRKSHA